MNRAEHLNTIRNGHFDVLVVGGGITGAGIALDAALRGLSVALLERTDFGAGTSGVSSKMVHAGLRYIFGDPDLVKEASKERQRLFYACAHLARPLEYIVPVYENTQDYDMHNLPQILDRYDELAEHSNSRNHQLLNPEQLSREMPQLRSPLVMVGSYWDGVMDDARVTIEVIHSAVEAGARVLNHAPVLQFVKDPRGKAIGVKFQDDVSKGKEQHTVTASAIVSATGVYTDLLLEMADHRSHIPVLRPTKGIHLIFRKSITNGKAFTIPMGKNILTFLVPIFNDYLIMGTTDTDYPVHGYEDLDIIPVNQEEVVYNLKILDDLFPGIFTETDIIACYSGVRPLIHQVYTSDKQMSESDVSRAHQIWQTPSGVWAISGGKYTTFRLMAEQLVDRVVGDLQNKATVGKLQPCSTAKRRYHGSPALTGLPGESESWITSMARKVKSETDLPWDCCLHLCEAYGTSVDMLVEQIKQKPVQGSRLGEGRPIVTGEIYHAVKHEMCLTVSDFLIRRTPLRFMENQGLDIAPKVAEEMAKLFDWDQSTIEMQIQDYRNFIEGTWTS